jgi:hypothetical protein
MKRSMIPLGIFLTLLVTVLSFAAMVPHPTRPYNCFLGVIYDGAHRPVPGVTVKLFSPGGGVETFQTNDHGEYWFCRSYGGWIPGTYVITVGCCQKSRSRSGDGDIHVDFVIPCNCQ